MDHRSSKDSQTPRFARARVRLTRGHGARHTVAAVVVAVLAACLGLAAPASARMVSLDAAERVDTGLPQGFGADVCDGVVVWSGLPSATATDYEVFSRDRSGRTTRLSNDPASDFSPMTDGTSAVWMSYEAGIIHIMATDVAGAASLQRLDGASVTSRELVFEQGRAAWTGYDGSDDEIFLWDASGGGVVQVTQNGVDDSMPSLSGDSLAWITNADSDGDVVVRDLATGAHTQITDDVVGDALPAAASEWVAWVSRDGLDTVVKIWDGETAHVLGETSYAQPVAEDGIVGWISPDDEIRLYVGRPGTDAAAATVGHTFDNRDLELSRGRLTWLGVNGTLRDDVFVNDVGGSGVFTVAVSPTLPWGGLESDLGELVWTGGQSQDHVWFRKTLGLTRLAGATRYETAVEISRNAYPQGAKTAVLATGENYPDALCGVPLAAAFDCPLLLTRSTFLNDSTAAELERLGVERVVILGETGAVSDAVRESLQSRLGGIVVERIGGTTRFETAELIARRFQTERPEPWTDDETVVLATGQNFPDALAAGPPAAAMGWPILLVTEAGVPAPTQRAVDDLGFAHSVLTGGEVVMPPSVATEMPDPVRLGGADRFETAERIADHSLAEGWLDSDEVCLATGWLFPDALTGGVLGGQRAAPLVLTSGDDIRPASLNTLYQLAGDCMRANVFGGEGAVTAVAEGRAFDALFGGQ